MGTEAPGRTLLKVTGILLIVFGAIATLLALLAIVVGGVVGGATAQGNAAMAGALLGGLTIVMGVVALIGGVFNLIAGIMGVKNADKPEKANGCFVIGIIMVVIQVISFVFSLINGSVTAGTIISGIIGFVLPVLYLLGAYKNKSVA